MKRRNATRARGEFTVSDDTADTRRRLRRVQIQESAPIDGADESSSQHAERIRGQRSEVARDDKAGISTSWQVLYGGQYTNPENAAEQRSVKVLRIGKGGSKDGDKSSADGESYSGCLHSLSR